MTLLQRIESANEPRRELFEEAGQLLHGPYRTNWSGRNFYCFTAMLDAQAWTSAANTRSPFRLKWTRYGFSSARTRRRTFRFASLSLA